jgi:DNA-binding NtrC family response regulator
MTRLLIALDDRKTEPLEVDASRGLLVGRDPLPERCAAVGAPLVDTVTLDLPNISGNHLAAWPAEDGGLTLLDVGSRNGSWLQLPPGARVHVSATEAATVRLGEDRAGSSPVATPPDVEWKDGAEFGPAVAGAVRRWLGDAQISATVRLSAGPGQAPGVDHPGRIPLASGAELSVIPLQTMDSHWHQVLRGMWKYVDGANARFQSEETTRAEGLTLASPAIRRVHRQVVEAAQRGARLMLLGPSGSGKEGLARVFHRHTGRAGAFVARNCAMLSRELVRAELFGAEPGAFTGATRRIIGAVEHAHGGTLFLDELGEMPGDVQPMLLRFLDRGEFERLGDYGATRLADVRLVAATNRDLRESIERGDFRSDLWYRLSNEVIEVPPLRERFEDVQAYLQQRAAPGGGSALERLSEGAEAVLRAHPWEGNFRELDAFASRLLASGTGPIDADTCARLLARGSLAPSPAGPPVTGPGGGEAGQAGAWTSLTARAASAFAEDFGHDTPGSWDEVKEFLEKYLKPVLFVRFGGEGEAPAAPDDAQVRRFAHRLDADRGTAAKQLQRYFERFHR